LTAISPSIPPINSYAVNGGQATSAGSSSLTDSNQSWATNAYANYWVNIVDGTGAGQWKQISSNTANVLTVASAWNVQPDSTSQYYIYSLYPVSPPIDNSTITINSQGQLAAAAGLGIVAKSKLLAQTGSVTGFTYTTPNDGTTHLFAIYGSISIIAISSGTLTPSLPYTDENATSRANGSSGITSSGIKPSTGWGLSSTYIWADPNTTITWTMTFSGTSITYDEYAVLVMLI
jgi:hypothetical protein